MNFIVFQFKFPQFKGCVIVQLISPQHLGTDQGWFTVSNILDTGGMTANGHLEYSSVLYDVSVLYDSIPADKRQHLQRTGCSIQMSGGVHDNWICLGTDTHMWTLTKWFSTSHSTQRTW